MCLQYREKRYFDLFSITGIFGKFVASGGEFSTFKTGIPGGPALNSSYVDKTLSKQFVTKCCVLAKIVYIYHVFSSNGRLDMFNMLS